MYKRTEDIQKSNASDIGGNSSNGHLRAHKTADFEKSDKVNESKKKDLQFMSIAKSCAGL